METIERLVRTWIVTGQDLEVEKTVTEIVQGRATLLHLVKALGEYLTAEEDDLRTKGVEFLSLVIGRCPAEKLHRQSVRVLVAFYCGKLEDSETIVPALKGLVYLTSQPAFTSADAVEVIKALFMHVKMQALVQHVRFQVFTIVDTLVARHRDALKAMGDEFLSGYIALADGEKDPRNLLVAFAIARVLLIEFEVTKYIEDLFNIIFCYFPITFRPPPDDPYKITTDDLRNCLRACLNASPAFGPLAIPLFLEKLTAGSPATKRDTLQTLNVCLPIYGIGVARNFARKLWNSLKLEIFQPTDSATEIEALKTTQVLIKTSYPDNNDSDAPSDSIEGLAKDACLECIEVLREPEKSQAKPAIKVLCAFMSTTPAVSRFTLSQVIPHLVKLYLNPDEIANRAPILKLLADLVVASRDSVKPGNGEPAVEEVPLLPYKDVVLGAMTVGVKTGSTCLPALEGLKGMVTTQGLLTDEELGFVVLNINEVLEKDDFGSDDISDATLDLLTIISETAAWHVSNNTLPQLFSTLPDHAPAREAESERLKYWRTLASLARLCKQPDLFETLVVRLSTKLELICIPSPSADGADISKDAELSAAYAHSILRTIADVLRAKVDAGHVDVAKYVDRFAPRLYHLFIYSALLAHGQTMVATDPRLVLVAGQIVALIVQTLPAPKQEQFVKGLFDGYLNGNVGQLAEGFQKLPADRVFRPLADGAPTTQRNLVAMFSAAIIALRKEVSLPVPDVAAFLESLLQWNSTQTDNVLQRDAVMHAIASIINKQAAALEPFLSNTLTAYWTTQIADPSVPPEKRRDAIAMWSWMTKALLVSGHPLAASHTDRLFALFDDAEIGWDAARAIGAVVSADTVLTKKHHAVIKLLYAQKFCGTVLPRILAGAQSAPEPRRQNACLVALAALVRSVPRTAYTHEMPALMPLLLRGLDLPDTAVRASVLDTLLAAAESDLGQSVVAEHAASLVTTMLRNSQVAEMPAPRVRAAALRYLAVLPRIVRYDVLHPEKARVLRELASVLDDPKRAVRKEAVEARTNWFKFTG